MAGVTENERGCVRSSPTPARFTLLNQMKSSGTTPVVNASFHEDGFNQDPYPMLEEIRRAGPIVYNELLDRWMVTAYPLVLTRPG